MSKYLDQLQGEFPKPPTLPTAKGAKSPFCSSCSTQGSPVSEIESAAEAAEERAAILEYDGGLDRQEAEQIAHGAAQDYYNHLMGVGKATGCCYAPRGRLCPEGQRLRDIYVQAVEAAPRGR